MRECDVLGLGTGMWTVIRCLSSAIAIFSFNLDGKRVGFAMEPGSQAWKKAQAERLEISRAIAIEDRKAWAQWEQEKKEAEKREAADQKGWWRTSSWWSWSQSWSQADKWATTSASSGHRESLPPPDAGAAAIRPQAPWEQRAPDAGRDLLTLRNVALTPASFMPQRHVTMALGRPVVVLLLLLHALGADWVGWVVKGR